ncbi:MAG: lamin tail domain-containing protein [Myxococcota bacterium]
MSAERNRLGVGWLLLCAGFASNGCSSQIDDGTGPSLQSGAVVISEIMYHPADEQTDDELHEFIEIANRSDAEVDVSGWKLKDNNAGLAFTFPAGTKLAAGAYLAVARDRAALALAWGGDASQLIGDYTGGLDNGGETVILSNASGKLVDSVTYDDAFPWPIAADELGVGEDWLPAADRPMSKHRFKGRSLERIDLNAPSNDPASWEASALDGATPGRANGVAGSVFPTPISFSWGPANGSGHLIGPNDSVKLSFEFSTGDVPRAELRYFVDDITRSDETTQTAPLSAESTSRYSLTLPPSPEGSLVRYQVWAERAGNMVQVFPRASDPIRHRSYFVTPNVASSSRVYHLFITPEDWGKLESSLSGSDVRNCAPSAEWNANYPATFVFQGEPYDVVASYSGSRYQRPNGLPIVSWSYPGPRTTSQGSLEALSWKIKFPRSQRFDDQRAIKLNKMRQGFPGVNSLVESQLLTNAGLFSYRVRFARLHINGGYYHYVAEMEDINQDMVERLSPKGTTIGDLFKDDGTTDDSGLLFRGDFAPPSGGRSCSNVSVNDRYAATYPRVNYEHRGPALIIDLINALDRAVASGIVSEAVKAYFNQYWDVEALLKTFAIRNWCGVWDDTFHNVFPYRRADGKWILIQQDFEWDFGLGSLGEQPGLSPFRADETFYIGAYQGSTIGQTCELSSVGSRCNNLGFSRLKNAFIQNFRNEFDATLRNLSKTVLEPGAVSSLIDQAAAQFNQADWNAAPASKTFCGSGGTQMCNFSAQVDAMKKWATDRNAALVQRLGR